MTFLKRPPARLSWTHRKVYLYVISRKDGACAYEVARDLSILDSTTSSRLNQLVERGYLGHYGVRKGRDGVRNVTVFKENRVLIDCCECDKSAYRFWGVKAYCGNCIDAAIRMDPDLHECPQCGEQQPHNVCWRGDAPCKWCQQAKADNEEEE